MALSTHGGIETHGGHKPNAQHPEIRSTARMPFERNVKRSGKQPHSPPADEACLKAEGKAVSPGLQKARSKVLPLEERLAHVGWIRFPSRAHKRCGRSCNRQAAALRRPTIHDPLKAANAAPRQRGATPDCPIAAAARRRIAQVSIRKAHRAPFFVRSTSAAASATAASATG